MKYWLYTWEYPGVKIRNNEFGIYEVVREFYDHDEDVDMLEIGKEVYDPNHKWKVGDIADMYEDATTEDIYRVVAFLFDQRFW